MIFVTGVHGVGKSTYSKMLADAFDLPAYSCGNLLVKAGIQSGSSKYVKDIEKNQSYLVDIIRNIQSNNDDFIIDGHVTLMNYNGVIVGINPNVFRKMGVSEIIYLKEKAKNVYYNLLHRGDEKISERKIKIAIDYDIKYAESVSKELKIPIHIIKNNLPESRNQSMLIPIKNKYAELILSGKKKFEFRKSICTKACDEMYLYSITPQRKVVGKCKILGKTILSKEKMWNYVCKNAGISADEFFKYYLGMNNAAAYILGETERFVPEKELLDYGIHYHPQSYIYL